MEQAQVQGRALVITQQAQGHGLLLSPRATPHRLAQLGFGPLVQERRPPQEHGLLQDLVGADMRPGSGIAPPWR